MIRVGSSLDLQIKGTLLKWYIINPRRACAARVTARAGKRPRVTAKTKPCPSISGTAHAFTYACASQCAEGLHFSAFHSCHELAAVREEPFVTQVSLSGEEGGEPCELVPGGASQPVTPDNVYQYVKLYAELRMVGVCQEALVVREITPTQWRPCKQVILKFKPRKKKFHDACCIAYHIRY